MNYYNDFFWPIASSIAVTEGHARSQNKTFRGTGPGFYRSDALFVMVPTVLKQSRELLLIQQVCSQPHPWAVNMTLSTFAAKRRAAVPLRRLLSIDLLTARPTAANPTQWQANDGTDWQTDTGQFHRLCSTHYVSSVNKSVQLPTSAVKLAMPALAAAAMLLLGAQRRAPINQYLLPTPAQQQIRCSRQMGQTDRQMDARPYPQTMLRTLCRQWQ